MLPALKHSKPGSVPSGVRIDPDYLRQIVCKLAFPRSINSQGNSDARKIIVEEFADFIPRS